MDILIDTERIAGENNSQYAYRVLQWNIMSLNLRPGQIINESELTLELGISRTPIREAIFKLREERLIEVYSQNKTCVSFIDYKLVQEALLIRSAVESAVLCKLCGKLSEETKLFLFENLNRQHFYAENSALRLSFFKLDDSFHKLLFEAADCSLAWEIIKKASTHLDRVRYYHLQDASSVEGVRSLYQGHMQLLNLIIENRPDEIPAVAKKHITERPSAIWERPKEELDLCFINVPERDN